MAEATDSPSKQIATPHLVTIIKDKSIPEDQRSKTKTLALCTSFTKKLTRARGPMGVGPFVKARCMVGGTVGGTVDGTVDGTKDSDKEWRLEISRREDNKEKVNILLLSPQKNNTKNKAPQTSLSRAVVSFDLVTPSSVDLILSDERTSDLLALMIAESMPMRAIHTKKSLLSSSQIAFKKSKRTLGCISEPKGLVVYQLRATNGVPQAYVVHEMIPSQEVRSTGKDVTYLFDKSAIKKLSQENVFFSHRDKPKESLATLMQCLDRRTKKLSEKWYDLMGSVYVGLRYGLPLIKSDYLFESVPFFGVFGEFRSGLLDGLKVYYDMVQDAAKDDGVSKSEYSFSRLTVGVSFDDHTDLGVFNYFDVTPKLGVTTLRLSMEPSSVESEAPSYEFSQFRSPTIGIEVGAEKRHSYGLFRLWNFYSYSVGVLAIDKKYSTRTVRLGMDALFDLIDLGSISLGVLGFGVADYTSISSKVTESAEAVSQDAVITNLSTRNMIVGGGVTLKW